MVVSTEKKLVATDKGTTAAVSKDTIQVEGERRGRYTRRPTPIALLTPLKLKLLGFLVECRILSLPQLASLGQLSQKATRRQMRALFDAGLVEVVAVSRAALAPEDAPNSEKLLFGTAPNFYTPTAAAVRVLVDSGTLARHYLKRSAPFYGPKNGLFLRHELLVRDVRVWLEQLAFAGQGRTTRWEDGVDAVLDLQELGVVRPDSWFVFEMQRAERLAVLVGLVEVDRGTERGKSRWSEKLTRYHALFASERLQELTGYVKARILVFCPSASRRDLLASLIEELAGSEELAARFWIVEMSALSTSSLSSPIWRVAGQTDLIPLLKT